MGACADSDKAAKRLASRKLRRLVRHDIRTCLDFDFLVLPVDREVSDVWDFPKDGKCHLNPSWPEFAKLMRK